MKDYCPTCGGPIATTPGRARIGGWLLRTLRKHPGAKRRELLIRCANRDRDDLKLAMADAVRIGTVTVDADGRMWATT